jgi:hypothetical protein
VAAALAKMSCPTPHTGKYNLHIPLNDPSDAAGLASAEAAHRAEGERLSIPRQAHERQRLEQEAAARVEAARQADLLKAREAELQRAMAELEAEKEAAATAFELKKERVAAQRLAVARKLELLSTPAPQGPHPKLLTPGPRRAPTFLRT